MKLDHDNNEEHAAALSSFVVRGEIIVARYLRSADAAGFAVNSDHLVADVSNCLRERQPDAVPLLLSAMSPVGDGPLAPYSEGEMHWRLLAVSVLIDLLNVVTRPAPGSPHGASPGRAN